MMYMYYYSIILAHVPSIKSASYFIIFYTEQTFARDVTADLVTTIDNTFLSTTTLPNDCGPANGKKGQWGHTHSHTITFLDLTLQLSISVEQETNRELTSHKSA